ncbi:selenoprotein M, isoform CRA_c, partial [Mus musculus]
PPPPLWVQPAERLLPGTDEHPTVAAVAAAASCSPCGSSHLHHQLPTGLEPSSRPGQGAGGDLWRMTVESPKGGEGLCHRGHSTVPQPGDEAPPWGRPRTRAVKPKLPGTRANPTQPNDPGRDQCAGTGARLLPQVGAGSSGAPRVPVGAR